MLAVNAIDPAAMWRAILMAWLVAVSPLGLPAQGDVHSCMPTEQRIAVGANTDSLAGRYRITFVATSGRRSGKSASGVLVLQAHDSAGRYLYTYHFTQRNPFITEPYYGYTTVAPDSIAASPNGAIDSRDSVMPGVALQVYRGTPPDDNHAPALTLLFGQGTTRRDRMRSTAHTSLPGFWRSRPTAFAVPGTRRSGRRQSMRADTSAQCVLRETRVCLLPVSPDAGQLRHLLVRTRCLRLPTDLPADLTEHLVAFAESWARHAARSQPSKAVRTAWDGVIRE